MRLIERIAIGGTTLAVAAGALALGAGAAQAAVGAPSFGEGASGLKVYCAQIAANFWIDNPAYDVTADGSDGPATNRLIVEFQKDAGLQDNGEVGPITGTYLWNVIANEIIPDQGNYGTRWGVPISNCYQVLPTEG
jgi:peptidoglycan hydrolase-like protein with peptidoglycan-binding domain